MRLTFSRFRPPHYVYLLLHALVFLLGILLLQSKSTNMMAIGTSLVAGGIPVDEVHRVMAWTYHGVTAAVASGDIRLLKESLAHLHSIGFKHCELASQSSIVQRVYRELEQTNDCAVGMSSIGPLLYVVTDDDAPASRELVRRLCMEKSIRILGSVYGRNQGYSVFNEY